MSTSAPETALATDVSFDEDMLIVTLHDGRVVQVPLQCYPTLHDATAEQRADWRLIGDGVGIHWPQLDEDLSVRGLLAPSLSRPTQRKSA